MAKNVDTTKMKQLVIKYANKYKVPVDLALALVNQESGFNPNAKSHAGAMGLGQLMPATAKSLGVTNAYDPEQNAEASMRHLGNLIIHYKGNTDLALAAYNAGMGNVQKYGGIPPFSETQNYVKSINAGRKNYAKVASNDSLIAQNINDVTKLQSKGGERNMSMQGGVNMNAMPSLTGGYSQDELIARAIASQDPFTLALSQFRNGQITYDQLATQFPNQVQRLGITPQMQGAAMTPAQQQLLNRRMDLSPEQMQQIAANDQALRQQMIDAQTGYNQGLSQQMQNQYDRLMQAAANDPRLQDTGYYVDPRLVNQSMMGDAIGALANGIGGGNIDFSRIPSYADRQRALYQAQVANQYGIPYEQLMAGRQGVYENQLKILAQQAADLKEMANQGQISQRTLMTELAKINKGSEAVIESMKQNTEYQKAVAPEIIKSQGDITKQEVTNQGNVNTTGMTQAGGIASQNISTLGGIANTERQAQATEYNADRSLEGTRYTADTRRNIESAKLPYYASGQVGAYLTGASGLPNYDPIPYLEQIGVMTPQTGVASKRSNQIVGQPQVPTLFQQAVQNRINQMNQAGQTDTFYPEEDRY